MAGLGILLIKTSKQCYVNLQMKELYSQRDNVLKALSDGEGEDWPPAARPHYMLD